MRTWVWRRGICWGFCFALLAGTVSADDGSLHLIVWKSRHVLEVLHGARVVRRFAISLGASPIGAKDALGDGRTPVGHYYVYEKRPSERFRWFLALNYPDSEDADRAFNAGRISADTWADIWLADKQHEQPPWNTPLGAFVGIHGTGVSGRVARLREVSDWTDGCIALRDADADEIYAMTPVGTKVEIRE